MTVLSCDHVASWLNRMMAVVLAGVLMSRYSMEMVAVVITARKNRRFLSQYFQRSFLHKDGCSDDDRLTNLAHVISIQYPRPCVRYSKSPE